MNTSDLRYTDSPTPEIEIDILSAIRKLTSEEFAPRAKQYDNSYTFPIENMQALFRVGLNAATISNEFGGLGLSNNKGNIRLLWSMITEVAKADMSTARCWEGHNNAMMLIDNLGTDVQKDQWFQGIVERGELWAVWSGEPLLKTPGQTQKLGTSLVQTEDGYLLNGTKVFCTGATHVNKAILLVNTAGAGGARHASDSPESVVMLACDLADATVSYDDSWWKPIGMRGSVSCLVKFDNTFIPFENQIGEPGQFLKEEWQTYWTPQYAATFLGAAEAAYDYTLSYVKNQHRQNDPFIQQRVAKMRMNIQSAHMWLDHVAALWRDKRLEEAKLAGNMARYQIEQLATQTVDHATHACGARALIQPSSLERILRDLSIYVRHDNDDHVLATIGKSLLGESHDSSFFNSK
ncbi:acyl-CoA dehydrogenase family protein [Candidatus Thiothrix anitrata]|jgi:alkylation response protein AidB-like acyl-CoA dehydrogenase|uniref:Acyl-CoA/acyl-ACP dehydrogenase n=1 Tax=Candidatus Thiothrix anitrata TaxID=2823902 RepID=A0ABX7X0N0_9GAMM|nr:acyl-CoA dehydrogenase family protein [Candidatus Thiothrix anitrata]QTR49474.1 acyl-CoA/acyl-ACP dehydrogenase [Candidatus Thiothrix anitrata]